MNTLNFKLTLPSLALNTHTCTLRDSPHSLRSLEALSRPYSCTLRLSEHSPHGIYNHSLGPTSTRIFSFFSLFSKQVCMFRLFHYRLKTPNKQTFFLRFHETSRKNNRKKIEFRFVSKILYFHFEYILPSPIS